MIDCFVSVYTSLKCHIIKKYVLGLLLYACFNYSLLSGLCKGECCLN